MIIVNLLRLLTVLLAFNRLKLNNDHEGRLYKHIYSVHTIHLNLRPDGSVIPTEGHALHGPLVLSEPGLAPLYHRERETEREKQREREGGDGERDGERDREGG